MSKFRIQQLALLTLALGAIAYSTFKPHVTAQEGPNWHEGLPRQYDSKWLVHDLRRPLPVVVTPGVRAQDAPSDAISLFDGTSLDQWVTRKGNAPAAWVLRDGYMEQNNSGSIQTKKVFDDVQLHICLLYTSPSPRDKA